LELGNWEIGKLQLGPQGGNDWEILELGNWEIEKGKPQISLIQSANLRLYFLQVQKIFRLLFWLVQPL